MQVEAISASTSWAGIDIPTYIAFTKACNLDLMNSGQCKRNEVFLNGKMENGQRQPPQFQHLKRDPNWETYYKPLMERYINSLRNRLKV